MLDKFLVPAKSTTDTLEKSEVGLGTKDQSNAKVKGKGLILGKCSISQIDNLPLPPRMPPGQDRLHFLELGADDEASFAYFGLD